MDELKSKYKAHKYGAKRRGIEFKLTFEEWKSIWGEKIHSRKEGSLGMLRTRDEGGYEVGNVRIGTHKENMQEAAVCTKVFKSQVAKASDYRKKPPIETSWLSRNNVFAEYVEEDDDSY